MKFKEMNKKLSTGLKKLSKDYKRCKCKVIPLNKKKDRYWGAK